MFIYPEKRNKINELMNIYLNEKNLIITIFEKIQF